MKAISIHQPWAWLIVEGYKDIENRTWLTAYRGPVLIHAGLTRADPEDVQAVLSDYRHQRPGLNSALYLDRLHSFQARHSSPGACSLQM